MTRDKERLQGAGPWTFENPEALDPGETWVIDFRNMEYNGRKRWFQQYLPLDDLQVTNADTGNSIAVEINNEYESRIPANSVETFNDEGFVNLVVRNKGGSTIATGDIVLEASKSAYDVDDEARERKNRSVAEDVLRGVMPGL